MPVTTVQQPQQNQYELQRQRIREEEQRSRKAQQDAMQRRLASRGFTAGTGYAETQQNRAETEARQGERQRLTDIDIAEAGAGEQRAETERARQWQTGEREAAQKFASQESTAGRQWQTGERAGTQDWQAAQNAEVRRLEERRLTDAEKAQAAAQGLAEDQFAEQKLQNVRQYGLSAEEMNQRQQQIDDAAAAAQSEVDFRYWATEAGYTDAERQRAWQERQGALERTAVTGENTAARQFQLELTGYQDLLTRGRMDLADVIEQNQQATKTRTDMMYQFGLSKTPVDTTNLTQLEKDAYQMGQSGRAYGDMQKYVEDQTSLRNQLVVSLAEAPELKDDIQEIWKQFEELINPSLLYGQGG